MPAAPLPDDEQLRLDTLASYQILDTPSDKSFDNLVRIAAEHFDVPISLVSLIDADRQWFKAATGLETPETPRDSAFCAHAILRPDEVLVIEDAQSDRRFASNPLVTADPSIRFYAGAPIKAENGQPLGTLCIIDTEVRRLDAAGRRFLLNLAANAGSMLELHRKNAALAEASLLDPLTGLANRRAFDTALSVACAGAARGVSFGLLALDLDRFKAVNDEFGHAVGDRLLQEVARRLRRVVRANDVVARLGGDEFAIIATGPIDLDGVMKLAQRVMQTFLSDMRHGAGTVPIRTSIGVALAPLHGEESRLLARAADLALYRAKRAGRRSIAVAGTSDGSPATIATTIADELLLGLAGKTVPLHWQPYADARSGCVRGYEALLRWNRPNGDPVSPTTIVAMAEQGGFIADLDRVVLSCACNAAAAWPRALTVSVNMSAWWFNTGDLVGLVMEVLTATGLAPERLTIELTEGTLVKHTERARERIATLRSKGVRIALDDFGTGYASLGYLHSFEFDTLKLDRQFVEGLGVNRRADAVATAVLALGKALDMVVCAEGVETPDQLRFLTDNGCDLAQGYLLGRPKADIDWNERFDAASRTGVPRAVERGIHAA